MLSVVIPANNEALWIGGCLDALLAQTFSSRPPPEIEVIVAANGCSDDTVALANARADGFSARGWRFETLDISEGSKPSALNLGDAAASGDMHV